MNIDTISAKLDKIDIILKLLKLTFLKISNSSLSNNLINKNCVDIKKMNGKVSYTIEGEFSNVKKRGNNKFVSVSLRQDTSSKIFRIITREKKIENTTKNIFKKDKIKYF